MQLASVLQPAVGGGFTGAMDSYASGLWGLYALDRLLSTYTGPLIRVRRSSDNAEQDIGYDGGGALDTAALASFVSSDSAYVVTWYDQSGGGNDLTQATTSKQPRIVNAGTYDGFVRPDAADDFMQSINQLPGGGATLSAFLKSVVRSGSTVIYFGNLNVATAGYNGFQAATQAANYNYAAFTGENGVANYTDRTSVGVSAGSLGVGAWVWDRASGNKSEMYRDGAGPLGIAGTGSAGSAPTGNFTADYFVLCSQAGTSGFADANFYQLAIYTADKTSDVAAISAALA